MQTSETADLGVTNVRLNDWRALWVFKQPA